MYLQNLEKSSQPLIGWRGWDVKRPGVLCSPDDVWLPRQRMEACCRYPGRHPHEKSPAENCSCGIYAFRMASQLRTQFYDKQDIFAELWLWGKVVEHRDGFRAQFAYPAKFWIKPEQAAEAKWPYQQMAYQYNVPLVVMDEEHPILVESREERESQARAQAEMRARKLMNTLQKRAQTKAKNKALDARAAMMPATKPGFKNLLEEIEWEANQAVNKR